MPDEVAVPMFEVVKHVTLPLLKMEPGVPLFAQFLEPIYKADPIAPGRTVKAADGSEKPSMAPPELAKIIDLVRNRPSQIIINEVLGSELRKGYPNDAYVGKSFRLVRNQLQGKRYPTFEIQEVKLKAATPAVAAPAAETPASAEKAPKK